MVKTKSCTKCKKKKPYSLFDKTKKSKDGYKWWCKGCCKDYATQYATRPAVENQKRQSRKKWYKNNRKKVYNINLKYRLKKSYNLTIEEWQQMFEQQQGQCFICGKHQSELKQKLRVDHSHQTGIVRGLLCDKCNTGIGLLQEDKLILQNAIKYLGKYNG